ncbi:hypothetical protein CSA80_01100 [Candidatus Saccharibacteria bacterium]|nr:MAG: hypothetical protein CR973_02055 [Candidatus Saccharibacteria bacterium]PID99347.1 MAG: hypothetical protein CSA80_01100 [Candidatus Saccharibacteria bacterium]
MNTALILHEDTTAALDAYLRNPAQSLLLQGKTGVGKTIVAREIAAQLLGTPVPRVETHPYVRLVRPHNGTIAIEFIRDLASFFRLRVPAAATAVHRVAILEDADTMTRAAQNALLKLLEEPPERTVILLTSSQPNKLLATIRSRVQWLTVSLPKKSVIVQALQQEGYAPGAIEAACALADGSLAQLYKLLSTDTDTAAVAPLDMVKTVLASQPFDRLLLVNGALKDPAAAKAFVDALVLAASASLHTSNNKTRWQKILEASMTAQAALAQRSNQKLVLSELMLAL